MIYKNYLALGDSYTIGESITAAESFPVQTANLLHVGNIAFTNPEIIAKTGWTTGDLLHALENDPPKKTNYDLVTLLIGVNNQFQHRSIDEYKIQFTELLNSAIFYAGGNRNHVFVISIPDYSVTPFASVYNAEVISSELTSFNEANKNISLSAGVHYCNITPISQEAKNNPGLLAADNLHPSAVQYKKWSDLIAPVMLKEIN